MYGKSRKVKLIFENYLTEYFLWVTLTRYLSGTDIELGEWTVLSAEVNNILIGDIIDKILICLWLRETSVHETFQHTSALALSQKNWGAFRFKQFTFLRRNPSCYLYLLSSS